MTSKHTPGPWHQLDYQDIEDEIEILSRDGTYISSIDADGQYGLESWKEIQANACLIAAAPEMYEALKRIKYWFDTDPEIIDAMGADERADHMRQVEIIRAAIAKAEGKS